MLVNFVTWMEGVGGMNKPNQGQHGAQALTLWKAACQGGPAVTIEPLFVEDNLEAAVPDCQGPTYVHWEKAKPGYDCLVLGIAEAVPGMDEAEGEASSDCLYHVPALHRTTRAVDPGNGR